MSRHSASTSPHSMGTDTPVIRIAILGLAIFFLMQPAFSQGPAVNSLSSGLSEIANRSGKKTVAVVDFTDLQGCVTELGRYMAEDISVALVNNAKEFEVIDRTNLRVLMQEHKLASTGIIDPATARKLGQVAGVDAIVTGTITPVGDSVHVSAKVLDTESAKMLGGITVDIPKTAPVQELIAKGVANCGSTPSSPGGPRGVQGQGGIAPAQNPQAIASGQLGNFQVSLTECRRMGDRVQCSGLVVNKGTEPDYFDVDNTESFMADNSGRQSDEGSDGKKINSKVGSGDQTQKFEPDLPLNFQLSGKGLSADATSVSIVLDAYKVYVMNPANHIGRITLRNIPIQAR